MPDQSRPGAPSGSRMPLRRGAAILGLVLLLGAIAAAIIPMWVMTAGMGLSAAGWGAVVLMIVFCFAVGGGLMFLIFFSARRGYDDAAHHGARRGGHRAGPRDPEV